MQAYVLPVVQKYDGVTKRAYPAVEVESLGQGVVTGIMRAALDSLLPEPLDRVLEREHEQREPDAARPVGPRREDSAMLGVESPVTSPLDRRLAGDTQ